MMNTTDYIQIRNASRRNKIKNELKDSQGNGGRKNINDILTM